jgi:hypothetical protein
MSISAVAVAYHRCKHGYIEDIDECEICARERRTKEAADDALALLQGVREVLEGFATPGVISRLEILEDELREMEAS